MPARSRLWAPPLRDRVVGSPLSKAADSGWQSYFNQTGFEPAAETYSQPYSASSIHAAWIASSTFSPQ